MAPSFTPCPCPLCPGPSPCSPSLSPSVSKPQASCPFLPPGASSSPYSFIPSFPAVIPCALSHPFFQSLLFSSLFILPSIPLSLSLSPLPSLPPSFTSPSLLFLPALLPSYIFSSSLPSLPPLSPFLYLFLFSPSISLIHFLSSSPLHASITSWLRP